MAAVISVGVWWRTESYVEYTKLGSTGMDVSRICLGCMGFGDAERWVHKWVLDEENSRPIIQKALELGINIFDTANVYSIGRSEEILGGALRDFANRDEVVIATKLHGQMREGPNGQGLSRKAILTEIDHSLRRLGRRPVSDPSLGLPDSHRGDDGGAI
jgi:aryl-alcohol dehydrogenase-like predicted oxidoreductase